MEGGVEIGNYFKGDQGCPEIVPLAGLICVRDTHVRLEPRRGLTGHEVAHLEEYGAEFGGITVSRYSSTQ